MLGELALDIRIAREMSLVNTLADKPYCVLFAIATTCSSLLNVLMITTGAKTSSWYSDESSGTSKKMVLAT